MKHRNSTLHVAALLFVSLIAAGTIAMAQPLRSPSHDEGCPDGVCLPNTMNFGFYQTRWRRWPTSPVQVPVPTQRDVVIDSLPAAETPDPRYEGPAEQPLSPLNGARDSEEVQPLPQRPADPLLDLEPQSQHRAKPTPTVASATPHSHGAPAHGEPLREVETPQHFDQQVVGAKNSNLFSMARPLAPPRTSQTAAHQSFVAPASANFTLPAPKAAPETLGRSMAKPNVSPQMSTPAGYNWRQFAADAQNLAGDVAGYVGANLATTTVLGMSCLAAIVVGVVIRSAPKKSQTRRKRKRRKPRSEEATPAPAAPPQTVVAPALPPVPLPQLVEIDLPCPACGGVCGHHVEHV